jgi:chromosome segregation protein
MYLKRLEIQGFKTFAQRTVFEFRPGVTAVVGPNGSGKSNLSDAVRWVLGEQSYTTLRCKRTEELLFSGGGKRPPAGFAEVSLTIDNSDRLLPIEFDEVTITRRATRAGENEYAINRARVRLRDVQEVTAPLGSSYTIINQGLVDAALALRPEERRRLFEDAAEISSFELRKSEAIRRLRETDTNTQRLTDLLGELEPRLRSLKRQANQARQHRELSAELQNAQEQFYIAQWRTAQAATTTAELDVARLAAALEQARTRQIATASEVRTLREALRDRRDHLGALHQQSSALHTRAEAAQRDLAVSDERLASLSRRAEDLERTRQDLDLRRTETERERAEAAAALESAESNLTEQREHLAACEADIAVFEATRRALARDLSAAQDAALKAATAVAETQSRAEQLSSQRERLLAEQAKLTHSLGQAEERFTAARQQVEAAQSVLKDAEAHLAGAMEAETNARAELDALRSERAAADEDLAAARRTLADAEARLESLNRLARAYAGTFAGVKAAMQWAERAGRLGFALVAAIIRTPAEIETAVEVALGSRLQNIVVETWQDAEDAIAELKRSGAGRATFLPLDTLRRTTLDRERSASGGANAAVLGVAADLVDYDPHYQAVVLQLLGRTLVVRDLPTARTELRRLAGGWTIVTLHGEQVNSGGAITGGAATKESGALRRERELRELPSQVEQARATVAEHETRRRKLDERIAAATQALHAAEAGKRAATQQRDAQRTALDKAERALAQAEQERTWQEQRQEAVSRDLAALAGQGRSLAAQHDEVKERAAAAQAHLEQLRARQEDELTADRAAQERFAAQRAAVASAEGEVNAQRALVKTHQQTLERLAQRQTDADQSVSRLAAEREATSAAHDRAEAAHSALLAEIDALRAQISPAEAELHVEEARLTELEKTEAEVTAALLDQEAVHNRAALDAQRARDRLDSLIERAAAEGLELHNLSLETGAQSEAEQAPIGDLQTLIATLKSKIERLGVVNPLALEEYEETAERQGFLSSQLEDLHQARTTLQDLITELETAMHARFSQTFQAVALEFERSFTRLFGGGTAQLHLTGAPNAQNGNGVHDEDGSNDTTNGRVSGVEIIARPPGKRQQNISLLSGGERTLTAAALLFAILTVNPSPFCILDEVDAALDESNVGRFREALAELTRTTQFIMITHNRSTIEAADTLYGVTMGDEGASKVLSLQLADLIDS